MGGLTLAKFANRALVTLLLCWVLPTGLLSAKDPEREFHQPLAKLKAEEVKEMRITAVDEGGKSGKSKAIAEQEFIRKLLGMVTPKDYPQLKEDDLMMSMPGTLLKVEFMDKDGKAVATIEMLGPWNLIYARGPGMKKSVTGSNRLLCEQLMKQFEASDPEAYAKAVERYREHISGKDPRELHQVLEEDKQ